MTDGIIREYFCKKCDTLFEVIHSSEEMRNKFCTSCGNPVYETGITKKIEQDFVVVRDDGVLVQRFFRRDLFFSRPQQQQ